jgi:predicted MFS family arabinose efflux permease
LGGRLPAMAGVIAELAKAKRTPGSPAMRERHLIAFLTTVQFVHMVDFVMMMPLGPMLMRSFAVGPQEFAIMVSAYTFSAAIAGILGGFLIDRFARRSVLLFLLFGLALATLGCGWAPNYEWMVVMRILAGASGGVLASLCTAVVADAIPVERRGRALGIVMAAFSLASIIGIPIGMELAVAFGWHAPFLAAGSVALLVVLWGWLAFPPFRGHLGRPVTAWSAQVTAMVRPRTHRLAFLLTVLMSISGFLVIPFISPSLVANVGFRDDQLQYVYLTGGIASVVTSPWFGRLADRLGAVRIFTVLVVLSVIPIVLLTNLGAVGVPLALVVTVLFIVFGSGRFVPFTALVTSRIAPHLRGSFMSFNSAVMSAATGLATIVAGHVVATDASGHLTGYPVVGWLSVACVAASIPVAWALHRAGPENHQP